MQIKDNYLNRRSVGWISIRVLIVFMAVTFIYTKINSSDVDWSVIDWPRNSEIVIMAVLVLMTVNWLLEAYRWQVSSRGFDTSTLKESLITVLGGLALNLVLPLTTGDAVYRIARLKDRYKAAAALAINRAIMMFITVIYGFLSIRFFALEFLNDRLLLSVFALLSVLGAGLWFMRKFLRRFIDYFSTLDCKEYLIILGVSLLRYSVFVFQFYLLLNLFLPESSVSSMLYGIGWIFFLKAVVPSIFTKGKSTVSSLVSHE